MCDIQLNKLFQIYSSFSLATVIPYSTMNNNHFAEHIKVTDGAAEEITLNEMTAIG